MKPVKNLVVVTGTYKDKNGETKNRYQTIGKLFKGDKGYSFKIDVMPVGNEWNGWGSLYDLKDGNGNNVESDDLPF